MSKLNNTQLQTIEWYAKEVPPLPQGNYEMTCPLDEETHRSEYYAVDENGCVKQLFGTPIYLDGDRETFYMVRPREVQLTGFDRELAFLRLTDAIFHRAVHENSQSDD
jgi:hypothetical protein